MLRAGRGIFSRLLNALLFLTSLALLLSPPPRSRSSNSFWKGSRHYVREELKEFEGVEINEPRKRLDEV